MPDGQQHTLDEETIELLTDYVCKQIGYLFYNNGNPGVTEPRKEQIKQALIAGGDCIRVHPDDNAYLIISHRNGDLYVHVGRSHAILYKVGSITETWDDVYHLADHAAMIGGSGVGLLWDRITFPPGSEPHYTVTVLDLKPIDIHTFLDGIKAVREGAAVA